MEKISSNFQAIKLAKLLYNKLKGKYKLLIKRTVECLHITVKSVIIPQIAKIITLSTLLP